jgi:choline dehydrogenase-like flavoprotein
MHTSGHVRSIFGDAQKSAATVVDDKGIASEYYAAINTNGTDRIHQASVCLSGATTGTLTCLQHCTVKCVVFEGTTAVALVLTKHNPDGTTTETTITPEHGGEIILCAGAFETPRILIASGLKKDAHVPAAGKKSSSPLPNLVDIGENLQDHVVLPYMLLSNWYDGWSLFHKEGTPGYAGKSAYPLNGIHGWVNLTADGTVWSEQCDAPPR